MAILTSGTDFTTGDQVTAATLDAQWTGAAFASGAVDNSTTQISSTAIIVKDGGITSAKLASNIAVTGTLGVGGQITQSGGGIYLNLTGSTTGVTYQESTTTGGRYRLGIESSTGGGITAGSTAYATVLSSVTNTPVQFGINNVVVGSFTSSGFSVGGTITSSSTITNSSATGVLSFTGATYGQIEASVADLYLTVPTAKTIISQVNGVTVTTLAGTGLSVTGTLNSSGGAWFGTGALATGATTGHLYIPTSAGAPTGIPATKTGQVALQFDSTNNKLYVYDGGWLSTAALT